MTTTETTGKTEYYYKMVVSFLTDTLTRTDHRKDFINVVGRVTTNSESTEDTAPATFTRMATLIVACLSYNNTITPTP